jgi:hypothetical protein
MIQVDTIKKKKFKSNLIQLTPDDLHQTALKIQEKSLHGKTSEYLMLNVLRGNEFEEWFRYLKFVFLKIFNYHKTFVFVLTELVSISFYMVLVQKNHLYHCFSRNI